MLSVIVMNVVMLSVVAPSKLGILDIVSNFHWLGQTHNLTAESVHYESAMFYNIGPGQFVGIGLETYPQIFSP
jgi:hypothetical protein